MTSFQSLILPVKNLYPSALIRALSSRGNGRLLLLLLLALVPLVTGCRPESDTPPAVSHPPTDIVKISLDQEGLYRVSRADLEAAGLVDVALEPAALRLSHEGEAVPYIIEEDNLIFYGQAPTSRYTPVSVYLLQVGEAGLTMPEEPVAAGQAPFLTAVPQRLYLEENNLYDSRAAAPNGAVDAGRDPWFWQTLQPQSTVTIEFELDRAAGGGQIRLGLWGATSDHRATYDHDFELSLNGQVIDRVQWKGSVYHVSHSDAPPTLFREGSNSILLDNTIEAEVLIDIMRLDWVEVSYDAHPMAVGDYFELEGAAGAVEVTGFSRQPLIVDVTDPAQPARLTGWAFAGDAVQLELSAEQRVMMAALPGLRRPLEIAPARQSDWRDETHQADLLIISTDELLPYIEPLIQARREQGLSVAAAPAAEIYDAFGYGYATPQAINRFLQYAMSAWAEPAPRYLLLVGEATYDYRAYQAPLPANHIPTMIVPVRYGGETISDNRLADVTGDLKPDLAIGRWPVGDGPAVAALAERTLAYEAGVADGRVIFSADGSSAEFTGLSDRLLAGWDYPETQVTKLYGVEAESFLQNWGEGAWLVNYVGHGSMEQWGREKLFSSAAAAGLQTPAAPPIVVQLTCLTGFFAHPTTRSLSEVMLLEEGGPVLVVSATSLTLSSHQHPFAAALLAGLSDPAVERMGDALLPAKRSLDVAGHEGLREISDTFGLLGDPSALIARP